MKHSFLNNLVVAAALFAATAMTAQAATLKIGAVAPKSGPLGAGAAVTQWPNVELWSKQVNAAGGIDVGGERMMVEIIEYDDKTNPEEHIKAAQRLATQDEVDFIVAPYGTAFNLASAPIYARYGYPHIAVSAITDKAPELIERYDNLFLTLGDTTSFTNSVVELLVDMRAEGKIGNRVAMVNVADAFGIELAEAARPVIEAADFEIVYDQSYPLGTPDLSPVMKGVVDSEPDAFVAWSYPPDTFALTEQAITQRLDVKMFYTAVATCFPSYLAKFGDKINGVFGAGGVNPDSPAIAEYMRAHREVTGKDADYWASANTYVSLQILQQAIEGAGTNDRAAVIRYIKDNSFDTIMGPIKFENQISNRFWTVGQWQNGKFYGVKSSNMDGAAAPIDKVQW